MVSKPNIKTGFLSELVLVKGLFKKKLKDKRVVNWGSKIDFKLCVKVYLVMKVNEGFGGLVLCQ